MPATPNPTLEELREVEDFVGGDIGAAQDELVRRLQLGLPAYIADVNARKGWSGSRVIMAVKPEQIESAPADLTGKRVGAILVGLVVTTETQGIGGVFKNRVSVEITSLDARIQNSQQVRVNWARARAIQTVLHPFLSGCTNENDERVWRSLVPTGYRLLTGDWAKEYAGTVTTYNLIQSPSMNESA